MFRIVRPSLASILAALVACCLLASPLLAGERVTLAMTEWPPYTGEDLPYGGFLAHLATAALEATGHEVFLESIPWKRALEETTAGKYCGLIGANYTEERATLFHYPREYWPEQHYILAHDTRHMAIDSLEELCPGVIGILNGSYLHQVFEDSCLEVDSSPSVELNVAKYLYGRVDYIIDTRPALEYYLTISDAPGELQATFIQAGLPPDKVYVVFSRACPRGETLVQDFNRGFAQLRENGMFETILREHGITPPEDTLLP